jgi:hypothetical protein
MPVASRVQKSRMNLVQSSPGISVAAYGQCHDLAQKFCERQSQPFFDRSCDLFCNRLAFVGGRERIRLAAKSFESWTESLVESDEPLAQGQPVSQVDDGRFVDCPGKFHFGMRRHDACDGRHPKVSQYCRTSLRMFRLALGHVVQQGRDTR